MPESAVCSQPSSSLCGSWLHRCLLVFILSVFTALVWVHFVFILVPDVLSQQILPSPWMCHFSFFWEELRSLLGAAAGPEPSFHLGSAEPCSSRAWNGCQCTLLTLWEFRNISLIKIVVVFVLPGSPFHLHHSDFASSLQEASVGGNSE